MDRSIDPDAYDDEEPQFEYSIRHKYYLSRYPVTNAQFDMFLLDPEGYTNKKWYTTAGKDWLEKTGQERPPRQGGSFDLPNHPVVNVTWYEALAFTRWLTNKMRKENKALKVWETGQTQGGGNRFHQMGGAPAERSGMGKRGTRRKRMALSLGK